MVDPIEFTGGAMLSLIATSRFPTRYGAFQAHVFGSDRGQEHIALVHGTLTHDAIPVVRIHSECVTGEALGSVRCECGAQLELSFRSVVEGGLGVIVYLRGQEGRGIGLANKIRAYALQDAGHDTVSANIALGLPVDLRDYLPSVEILRQLGIDRVRLLTNNPQKLHALQLGGIQVIERIPLLVEATTESSNYLRAKKWKLGHFLPE